MRISDKDLPVAGFFDREDALAVLGIAFCQRVFYNVSRSFNNVFVKGSFTMLVGLLIMSTGLLTMSTVLFY